MDVAALKNEIATLCCETAGIEFKSAGDIGDARFWPQLVRSIVAMHNGGGGAIIFGLDSAGRPVGGDLAAIRAIDPIHISDKARSYTDRPLPDVVREEFEKGGGTYPGWIIPPATVPLPFSRDGDVHHGQGKPEKVFRAGQVYVRRGASSVPADADDMARIIERARLEGRKELAAQIGPLAGLIATSQPGYTVQVLPPGATVSYGTAAGSVRVTTDPSAPTALIIDKFGTHPHRQTELIRRLATRLPGQRVTGHDIACIRKAYPSEIEAKDFVYTPPHSSRHYSEEFADWIVGKIGEDPAFLLKTRAACKQPAA